MGATKDPVDTTDDQALDTTETQTEIKTKPAKVDPGANTGITLESLRKDYNEGLPLEPNTGDGKVRENESGELRPVSPQEVADYRNVDVYYVLQAVDPDWRPDPAFEDGE